MYDIIEADYNSFPVSNDDFNKFVDIHQPLQNGNAAITLGLKKKYRKYIDTSFVEDISFANLYRDAFSFSAQAQLETGEYPEDFKKMMLDKLERKNS